jgi:pyruvate,water dikinase
LASRTKRGRHSARGAGQPAAQGEIFWLGDPACADVSRVGGKAASLSVLAHRYRVPPGFCIPAGAALFRNDVDRSSTASRQAVAAAYRVLGERCGTPEPFVAVRSSAVDEDGALASFAGQYETVLGVSGEVAVVEAIQRCRASGDSGRIAVYRHRQGITAARNGVAVLVQQLIAADIAVVAFSVNPVTGSAGEVVINATWGLGENLVAGSVSPDAYCVRKDDWTIVERSVAAKGRMVVLGAGGTRETDVPLGLQRSGSLDDARVIEVARLAGELETVSGFPVDIECAYQGSELYLLQCRPVTAAGEVRHAR